MARNKTINIENSLEDIKLRKIILDIENSLYHINLRIDKLEQLVNSNYEEIDARLGIIEAFYNGLEYITTNKKELQ